MYVPLGREIVRFHHRLVRGEFSHPRLLEVTYLGAIAPVLSHGLGSWVRTLTSRWWGNDSGLLVSVIAKLGVFIAVLASLHISRRRIRGRPSPPVQQTTRKMRSLLWRLVDTASLQHLLVTSYRGCRWIDLPIVAMLCLGVLYGELRLLIHFGSADLLKNEVVFVLVLWVTIASLGLLKNYLTIRLLGATPGIILWGEKKRFQQEFGFKGEVESGSRHSE